MNDKKIVHGVATKCRDIIFNKGISDISISSIEFSTMVLKELSEYNINASGLVGWLKVPNKQNRVMVMYVKVKLKNDNVYYIDIFSGEKVMYKHKMKKLKARKSKK